MHIGEPIEGVVVSQQPFGVFVDIGHGSLTGLVEVIELSDSRADDSNGPKVGDRVVTVLRGFRGSQLALTLRLHEVAAAVVVAQVRSLPENRRPDFLRHMLRQLDPFAAQAAVHFAWVLPSRQLFSLLHEAVTDARPDVAVAACRVTAELPANERATILNRALEHESPIVAGTAVWEAGNLCRPERDVFLAQALCHPVANVRQRAQSYLAHRTGASNGQQS